MQFAAGFRIGIYEVIAPIAAGGMGEVYRARDTRLGREVAIKVLSHHADDDPDRRQRFEQEARAVAALSHPNILAIYSFGDEGGIAYAAMELLDGLTVRDELAHGPMPPRRVIDLGAQMALGLGAAHDKGIVHRDVKPENIFVTSDGQVKLLDFGLARTVSGPDVDTLAPDANTREAITRPGVLMGTFGHMAPEQITGMRVDERTDIFALGTVLYEMLTGQRPFRGETRAKILEATLNDDPSPIATITPGAPPVLARIVMRCLEKAPGERFRDARDLAFALSASGASTAAYLSDARATRDDDERSKPGRAWFAGAWRRRGIVTGLIAAALIVGALVDRLSPMPAATTPSPRVTFTIDSPPGTMFADVPEKMLALSADGARLVFAVERDGQRELWVRALDAPTPMPLAGTAGASEPFWSPDGQSIGFFADSKLKRIDVDGSSLQELCDAPFAPRGAAWNADDIILFADARGGLSRVSASGGSPTRVTMPESGHGAIDGWPQFLPDGRRFLFLRQASASTEMGATAYLASLDRAAATQVRSGLFNAQLVSPDLLLFVDAMAVKVQRIDLDRGQLVGDVDEIPADVTRHLGRAAITASQNGTLAYASGSSRDSRVVWVDRTGRETGVVASGPGWRDVALSPDGSRLAAQRIQSGSNDLWTIDLTRGVPSRFTFSPDADDDPVWSPDGHTIAYSSLHDGVPGVYRKSVDGGSEELLFSSRTPVHPTTWSPDGRVVLFDQIDPVTASDVWVLPAQGGQPRAYLHSEFSESDAHVSPDGRWLAYVSDESGRNEVYVQRFPEPGQKIQVTTDGGDSPRWAPEGGALYFLSVDRRLMSAPIQMNPLRVGEPVSLFATSVGLGTNRYAVTRDGRHFVLSLGTAKANAAPLVVVLGWMRQLHRAIVGTARR
jgi:eukaryotic-like serine/threonine-protein kinase